MTAAERSIETGASQGRSKPAAPPEPADGIGLGHAEMTAIFMHAVDGIVTSDERGCIELFNPAAERIFGYRLEDIRGCNVSKLMAPSDAVAHDRYIGDYLSGQDARFVGNGPREVLARRSDGEIFPADVAISEAATTAGRKFIAFIRDISDRRARDLALAEASSRAREAADEASKAARAKSNLLSGMTHEFRTPLNAILGFSEILLLEDRETLSNQQREYVGNVRRAGFQLLELIDNLLELARQDAAQFRVNPQPVHLVPFLAEIEREYSVLARREGHDFTMTVDPALPETIIVDQRCLEHTLTNLLSNAIKFTREGGIELVFRLTGDPADELRLRCEVRDTGVGIGTADFEQLFEPFAQLENGQCRPQHGSGLGLAICKRLCALMQGEVGAEPNEPQGSIFWFAIPLALSRNASSK